VQHDFLRALEVHDCLLPWGWQPQYALVFAGDELVGACPTYLKTNSYGEFVFDWAWADAWQRNGLDYYPKLVTAVPYTPAPGPRLLVRGGAEADTIRRQLIGAVQTLVDDNGLSSAHWLFCEDDDIRALSDAGLLLRYDFQFHWFNRGYTDFDDFLRHFSSKKRKNVRRERRKVSDAGIRIDTVPGAELDEAQWTTLYDFYRITFLKKSGAPTLSLAFFRAMAHRLLAIFAVHQSDIVAGAICFEGGDTLYGRHWGCYRDFDSLHFEVCYYAGIEYCIRKGLRRFEPGAQGEHKIARGFSPVKTRSAHYVRDAGFREAIRRHLQHESRALDDYHLMLLDSEPYKKDHV
jgi:predicted N-acyltransferase